MLPLLAEAAVSVQTQLQPSEANPAAAKSGNSNRSQGRQQAPAAVPQTFLLTPQHSTWQVRADMYVKAGSLPHWK